MIKYTLLDNLNLFSIQPTTGVITTLTNSLDREVSPSSFHPFFFLSQLSFLTFGLFLVQTKDKYLVTVKIQDMEGASNGLFNTGTATIIVSDINDNPPTFTKPSVSDKLHILKHIAFFFFLILLNFTKSSVSPSLFSMKPALRKMKRKSSSSESRWRIRT